MAEPTIAWSEIVNQIYPRLHAADEASLKWWTEAQLRDLANEAIQTMARGALLFVRRDTSISTTHDVRSYSLPARHLATLHAAYSSKPLNPTDRALIDSLDYGADAAVCGTGEVPKRWYEDTLSTHAAIALYPSPSATATVSLIISQQPDLFTSTSSTLPIPACMKPFIADYVVAGAWVMDSDFSMPEVASHLAEKQAFYLDLFRAYWGPRQ